MKKVLEIFGEPIQYGGQESFVFNTLQAMDRENLAFDFLTPYYVQSDKYERIAKELNGKIYSFNLKFQPGKSRRNVSNKLDNFFKNHTEYDVVHIHSGSISILALCSKIAKKNGIKKVIAHSHMSGKSADIKHKLLKIFYNKYFLKYDNILCAPTEQAASWQFKNYLFRKRGKLIRNGIFLDKYKFSSEKRLEYRKKLNISSNSLVLGNVGRLSFEKNQMFLIELLSLFQHENVVLVLVGEGQDKEKLYQLAKKRGVDKKVIFVGNVSNVEDYLQAMDIFLFPSLFEGLGIAAIEAQASGLPVIASDMVPKDIAITKDVHFKSLNASISEWKKLINKVKREKNRNIKIVNSSYDVKRSAASLRKIYIS